MRERVVDELQCIERQYGVRVLLAVESEVVRGALPLRTAITMFGSSIAIIATGISPWPSHET